MKSLFIALLVLGAWGLAGPRAHAQPGKKPEKTTTLILPPRRDNRAVDSLRRVIAQHPRDTLATKALVTLVANFLYNDTAQARRYGEQAERLALAIGDRRRLARVRYNLATLDALEEHLDRSVARHLQAARDNLDLHDSLWAGHNYANASRRRAVQGRYPEAMRLALAGLRLREAAHDTAAVADSYGNIGQLYVDMQNQPAAQLAYEKSLAGWRVAKVPVYVINSLNHLAIIHRDAGRFARARAYVAEALAEVRRQPDSTFVTGPLITLGVIEQRQGRWAASLPPLRRVERQYAAGAGGLGMGPTKSALADLYSILGESLVQTGQPVLARPYLEKALRLARETGARQEEADALEGLGDLAAARGDYRTALGYHRQFEQLRDTLRAARITRQTVELQTKYETEQKEARNRVLAAELHTQQQISRRRNLLLWASLTIAGLLAGLAWLLVSRRRLRREVEFAQERQALTQQRAAAVLEAEETERRRIGADLHDGVGQLLTAVRLNLGAFGDQLAPQPPARQALFTNALTLLDESFMEVRTISHNLMPNALLRWGLARAVRDFLQRAAPADVLKVNVETVGLDDGRPLDPAVQNVLFRIIQELVQNVVKHARASELTLQLVRHEASLTVIVEDNGVGFDPAALGPEAGIGLRNVQSRTAYLGGRADFDAKPGRGTIVTLEVPLAEQGRR